jgi:hypothetical protein
VRLTDGDGGQDGCWGASDTSGSGGSLGDSRGGNGGAVGVGWDGSDNSVGGGGGNSASCRAVGNGGCARSDGDLFSGVNRGLSGVSNGGHEGSGDD